MQTRVFRGKTINEARRTALATLGKEPVVLTTRSVRRSGLAGLFGGSDVEIAATVAGDEAAATRAPAARGKGPFAQSAYADPKQATPEDALGSLRSELRAEIRAMKVAMGRPTPGRLERADDLLAEMSAMREALEQLAPGSRISDERVGVLRGTGIEGDAAVAIARAMRAHKDEAATVAERMRDAIADVMTVAPWPLAPNATQSRAVIALVGPTGVGKTTTIAKLAARAKMEGRSFTLVTSDTFRVGGVEQTKRYGELLGAPVEIARSASDLSGILARATTDLVFVDTSGRSPSPEAPECVLAAGMFKAAAEHRGFARHVLLCVTASIRASDAARVCAAFSQSEPTAIAVTKIDETDSPAGLVHAAFAAKLPVSVVCAGQRVPEDIAPATMGAVLDGLTRKARLERNAARGIAA